MQFILKTPVWHKVTTCQYFNYHPTCLITLQLFSNNYYNHPSQGQLVVSGFLSEKLKRTEKRRKKQNPTPKPAQSFVQIFPGGSSLFEQLLLKHKSASEPSQAWMVLCILISEWRVLLVLVLI